MLNYHFLIAVGNISSVIKSNHASKADPRLQIKKEFIDLEHYIRILFEFFLLYVYCCTKPLIKTGSNKFQKHIFLRIEVAVWIL